MNTIRLLLLVSLCATVQLPAQRPALKTRIVASDLRAPWELVWGPDNKIWITELRGGISTIDPATGAKTILLAKPSDVTGYNEDGLLGMVLHPQFATNPYVYVGYTYLIDPNIKLKIVRYRYNGSVLVEPTILLDNMKGGPIHNGCRLAFGPDGMLYLTAGDAGNSEDAQKVDLNNGKVLRISPDGSIPTDNPRAGSPVWSWGHRNQQGLSFGPNGVLYSSEHGATTDDEVNIIMKGRNYGWPRVEGLCNVPSEIAYCADSNIAEPIGTPWTPTLAPGAIKYYSSDLIPEWKDNLLMTAMKQQATLVVMKLSPDRTRIISEERFFQGVFGRLRAVCVSPDGRVFIGSSNYDAYGAPSQYPGCDWIIEITPQTSDIHDEGSASTHGGMQHAIFKLTDTELTAFALRNNATLIISDILGRIVSEYHDADAIGGGFHIDVASLTSGAYTAVIHTASGTQAFTFVR